MKITLKDIFIGKANGLEEAEDKQYDNLFYTGNQKYRQLAEDRTKFIITGRKGTGKTILAKYFEKEMNKKNIFTKTLTDRDIILKSFLESGKIYYERQEAELFVEYTLLCALASAILYNKRQFVKFSNCKKVIKILRNLHFLKKVVEKRFESENYIKDKFVLSRNIKNSSKINGTIKEKGGTIEEIHENGIGYEEQYIKSPYYYLIEELRKRLIYLLKLVPVNIVIDDLDEIAVKIDGNKSFIQFLIVFINKVHELNVEFRHNSINGRIIILLRSDIIQILNSESSNLNKIMSDSEIRLNWIKKIKSEDLHPLMDLLATKIKNSNSELVNFTNKEIVDRFFPQTIGGVPVMDHMLKFSFGRPRDIINMLNIIKDLHPEAEKFEASFFKETQLEYSTKFMDELRNEMASHFEAEKTQECFDILKNIGRKTFWMSQVKEVFEKMRGQIKCFDNEKDFINVAYEFGIIGNVWLNGNNYNSEKKYNYSWRYREDGFERPDYDKKFSVHLALRKKLLL